MSFDELVAGVDSVALTAFGELITYNSSVGPTVEVTAILDEQYVLARGTAEAGVEAIAPAVFLRLEDLPDDPENDEPTLTIRGVGYRVIERRPDGMGGIVLALRKVT